MAVNLCYYHALLQPRDLLATLWQQLQEDDVPPWMWGTGPGPCLTEFITYFSDKSRHLFLAIAEEAEQCLGMLWVDELVPTIRARAHMYFFKRARRNKVCDLVDICKRVLTALANAPFHLRALFFYTDMRATALRNFAEKRIGVRYLVPLPYYYPGETVMVGVLPLDAYRLEGDS